MHIEPAFFYNVDFKYTKNEKLQNSHIFEYLTCEETDVT